MRRLRVFNSGAFRLALLFVVIFAAGAMALVAAVNVAVSRYASQTTTTALIDESTLLRGEARGRDALGQLILRRERIVHAHRFLYITGRSTGSCRRGRPADRSIKGWMGQSGRIQSLRSRTNLLTERTRFGLSVFSLPMNPA